MSVGVVVNPTSGRGRGAAMGAAAVARLRASGGEVVDLSGDSHAHSTDNARGAVASGGIDVLAVVGGDGMAHLGVNACAGTPVALAIIAAGTGNDNARSLGLPIRQPEQAADLISSGAVRTIDAGRMRASDGDRWWIGVLGGGFDSVVTERAHRWSWPKGPMRYNLAVARELPVFTAIPYAIEVDGHRVGRREHRSELLGRAVAPRAAHHEREPDQCDHHHRCRERDQRRAATAWRGGRTMRPTCAARRLSWTAPLPPGCAAEPQRPRTGWGRAGPGPFRRGRTAGAAA